MSDWESRAIERIKLFGEGTRLEHIYSAPMDTDETRLELLRKDCAQVEIAIPELQKDLNDAYADCRDSDQQVENLHADVQNAQGQVQGLVELVHHVRGIPGLPEEARLALARVQLSGAIIKA
jgi:hypothetical protein